MKVFALLTLLLCASASLSVDAARAISIAKRELPDNCVLSSLVPPGNDSSTCQGMWNIHGFVCNKTQLIIEDGTEGRLIDRQIHLLQTTIIPTLKMAISKIAVATKDPIFKNLESKVNALPKKGHSNCWNKMKELRSSSRCSICSGNNYNFFLGHKAGVSLSTCQSLTQECDNHFGHLSVIISSIRKAQNFLDREKKAKPEVLKLLQERTNDILQNRKDILALMPLYKLLNSYIKAKQSQKMVELSSVNLCQVFLKLRSNPLLYGLLYILRRVVGQINVDLDAVKNLITINSRKLSLLSNWKSKSRSLTFDFGLQAPNANNLLSADIVVLKQVDNMFVSFIGSKGSDSVHDNLRPMNLSLAFP